jgi:hypothetical protein
MPLCVVVRRKSAQSSDAPAAPASGYTPGMKTAVSIPDPLFRDAERLAKRLQRSRSQLYADALREYVVRRSPDEIEAAMNRTLEVLGDDAAADYAFSQRATKRAWRRKKPR